MSLHPEFPVSPYAPMVPEHRWFPADEALRSTAYEKLLPPLVAKVRREVYDWRKSGYAGGSATSVALLRHWFEAEHLTENADGSLSTFRYYFAQREAVETVIWLYEVRAVVFGTPSASLAEREDLDVVWREQAARSARR